MSNRLSSGTNWPKRTVQFLSILFVIYVLTPLKDILTPDFQGLLPLIQKLDTLQIPVYILAIAISFLFGHIFCGYLCPVGSALDLLSRIRNSLAIRPLNISDSSTAYKILRIPRYIILYVTIDWIINGKVPQVENWILITAVSVVGVMSIITDRFWCRFLCPAGAVVKTTRFIIPTAVLCIIFWVLTSFTNLDVDLHIYLAAFCVTGYLSEIIWNKTHLHVLRIVKDEDSCTHCGECQRVCPYDIDLVNFGEKNFSADCTHCGECIAACRHSSLSVGITRKNDYGRGTTRFVPAMLIFMIIAASVIVEIRRNSITENAAPKDTVIVPSDSTKASEADTLVILTEPEDTLQTDSADDSIASEPQATAQAEPEPEPEPKPAPQQKEFRSFGKELYGFYSVDGKQVRRKREDVYRTKTAYVYDLTDFTFTESDKEKAMNELAGMIEHHEGSLGVFYRIDPDGVEHIDVKYVNPLRKANIYEAITASTWTVRDEKGKNSTVPAPIKFGKTGLGYVYGEHKAEFGF